MILLILFKYLDIHKDHNELAFDYRYAKEFVSPTEIKKS